MKCVEHKGNLKNITKKPGKYGNLEYSGFFVMITDLNFNLEAMVKPMKMTKFANIMKKVKVISRFAS